MKSLILFSCIMVVIGYLYACGNAPRNPGSNEKSANNPPGDTTGVISVNISGESIPYSEASPDNEIVGLAKVAFGDLDSMIARRYIRVLVPYTKTYYHIEGMKRSGLAYDLLNLFEKHLNDHLGYYPPKVRVIFIPVSRKYVIPLLKGGYADMMASGYSITPEREQEIDFSTPTVQGVKDIVVGGPSAPPLKSLKDLAGQQVFIAENSIFHTSLIRLNDSLRRTGLKPIDIEFTDPYLETEDILEMVNEGMIPFTITPDDIGLLWKSVYTSLEVYPNLAIETNDNYGWAFRENSPKLKAAVNRFIGTIKKGTLTGNMVYDRYIKNEHRLKNVNSREALADLNAYKALFKKYGETYDFDWLLLAAQAYQESQLKQETVSHAGAVGVMQVLPSTASNPPISITNIKNNAENNIHAGVKYNRYLIDQFFEREQMDELNQQLFALAAYNCGPGNVRKLRREAQAVGLDKNVWFNNVEILAAKHIGRETVQYVSNIYKYYRAYQALERYEKLKGKTIM